MMGRGDWIILRTAGRSTMALAASLAEDGYEVWTPFARETIQARRGGRSVQVDLPMLKGFVFANRAHLIDLLVLSSLAARPRRGVGGGQAAHPDFSVWRSRDKIHLVADAALNPLRRIARRRVPVQKAKPLKLHQRVRALEGAGGFQGMYGSVIESGEKSTFVCFGGGLGQRVEIATSFLLADEVEGLRSATDGALKKAA